MTDSLRRLILYGAGARRPARRRRARRECARSTRTASRRSARASPRSPRCCACSAARALASSTPAGAARGGVRRVLELVARERLELDAERPRSGGPRARCSSGAAARAGTCRRRCRGGRPRSRPGRCCRGRSERGPARRSPPQVGTPTVILEAGDDARAATEVGLDRAVADHVARAPAPSAGPRAPRPAVPRHSSRTSGRAAGSRRRRRARPRPCPRRGGRRPRFGASHVMRDGGLVAILAATHVQQVVRVRIECLLDARGGMLEAEPSPLAAGAQHGDVAAVGVDVHQLGIEREHPQRRHTITVLPT